MKTFNKKTLCAALAGLGVLGMVGAAQAVSLNPDGLGQVLIYPYYTVRANADGNAYNSQLSVVNSTSKGKAIKVRFIESKASHEVLDFNLYMSPQDVWTATVYPTADGAAVMTTDTTCSFGNLKAEGKAGVPFSNALFADTNADGEDSSLDRTREGYVEMIEMADIKSGSPTLKAITHVQGTPWTPPNCDAIVDDGRNTTALPTWAGDLETGTGGIFGSMTLINVNDARAVGFNAVALDGFFDPTTAAGDLPFANYTGAYRVPNTLWFPAESMNPNLSMAYPPSSIVVNGKNAYFTPTWAGLSMNPAVTGTWISSTSDRRDVYTPGLNATTAVLMRSDIYNEYATDNEVAAATDWVVTMPTKGLFMDRDPSAAQLLPRGLFQSTFAKNGSCDEISFAVYGREEEKSKGSGWSPIVPGKSSSLCWEANVVDMKGSGNTDGRNVLRAKNPATLTSSYDHGWAQLSLGTPTASIAPSTASGWANYSYTAHLLPFAGSPTTLIPLNGGTPSTLTTGGYVGLPMIGFGVQMVNNNAVDGGSLGKVWASYASTFEHRYKRTVQ